MTVAKFRLAVSIAILAIASLTVYFLVQDIYRLQKEYEIISAPLDLEYRRRTVRMNEEQYNWIREQLDEIQTMINLRKTAVVLVVAATAVTLLVLNKRKLFKEKHAVKFKFAVKFAVLVLIAVTVIYGVALVLSVQAYNQWKTEREKLQKWPSQYLRHDYAPFLASNFGRPYLMPTIWLMLIWMFATPFIITKKWDGRLVAFFLISAVCIPSFIVITRA